MLRRLLAAYGRRVAAADAEDLAEMLDIARVLDDQIAATIGELRDRQEVTWSSIGASAGITRQGAYQRWGRGQRPAS